MPSGPVVLVSLSGCNKIKGDQKHTYVDNNLCKMTRALN